MNYIARLQAELAAAQAEAAAKTGIARELRAHLVSEKFCGTDPDGSRRDWIAVRDIDAWMVRLLTAGA